jgi:hypothetical protein
MSSNLAQELIDAGKAVGLLKGNGDPNPDWFSAPDARLSTILSDPTQRAAFLDLLDQVAPPDPIAGLPAGEKWHPLLGSQPKGNVYLSVNSHDDMVDFGFAGELHGTAKPKASLRAHLPVVRFTAQGATAIAGKTQGPLDLILRVEVGWKYNTDAIGLTAISVQIHLAPVDSLVNLSIMLEGLNLDGSGPKDIPLDAAHLDAQAMKVVAGLINQQLHKLSSADPTATAIKAHLMPLLGLGAGAPAPPFPFATLLSNPAALQTWFNGALSQANAIAWLGHLTGLFGSALGIQGSGTADAPWAVPLAAADGTHPGLDLTLARVSQKLQVGLRGTLASTPTATVEATAVIAAIPLAGIGSAAVLPSAGVMLKSPGSGQLLAGGPVTAGSLRAGMQWNGTAMRPALEVFDVTLDGAHYDKIDLTNADSVVAAASSAVRDAILAALGAGAPAQSLAALAGLAKPSGDSLWPHTLDPAKLVANPTGAIAEYHRKALLSPPHHWGFLLAEVAKLAGLAGAVTGSGTRDNPWRVPLAPPDALSLELAAWNEQTSGNVADDQQLRIGLRLFAGATPWQFTWLAELLAFDLPQTGSGAVRIMAGQHASFQLTQAGTTPPFGGMTVKADSVGVTMDWVPGGSMVMTGVVSNITIVENGASTPVGTLHFPPLQPFQIANPQASIGLGIDSLETVTRLLVSRAAYSWAGMPGLAVSVLLGMKGSLPGLQADWPTLRDLNQSGWIFTNPQAALRDWFGRVASGVSADGSPFLPQALDWLRALLSDQLPDSISAGAPMKDSPLPGFGVYDDPWRMPLAGTDYVPVELLAWLEPAGPPAAWAAPLAGKITSAATFNALVNAAQPLGRFSAAAREAYAETDLDATASGLGTLATYLAQSDGVVPLASQVPADPQWTAGTPLTCAHHKQPQDSSAITQILNRFKQLPIANRAMLLVGPAFSDQTIWNQLRVQANADKAGSANPAAVFNLRVPGADPNSIDLHGVTAISDYYTADLMDDNTNDAASLSAQVARLAARINELRPGVKLAVVAHSTAGVAARAAVAANPAAYTALITLGTPHHGAPLDPLVDWYAASAVRFLQRSVPALPAGPVADALAHLGVALDQYLPPAVPNGLPVAAPYPSASFAGDGSLDTGGVPALALGGKLSGDLFTQLRTSLAAQATAAAGAATPAPTHLAFAIRGHLGLPDPLAGQPVVEASVRADAFRVALAAGAPEPVRPKHSFNVMVKLTDVDGWVAGGPSSVVSLSGPPSDTRARWAELGVTITPKAGGGADVTPLVRLHQASFHGNTVPLVTLSDVAAQPILGAVFHELNSPPPSSASGMGVLFKALEQLEIAVPDIHGGIGIAADALTAIQVDAAGYLGPRLLTALSSAPLLGFSGPPAGPWVMPVFGAPVELYLSHATDWEVGVRVAPANPITLGGAATLSFDARLHLPSLQGKLDFSFGVAATSVNFTSGGTATISADPWLAPLALPPTAASITAALEQTIPRILLSSTVTALLEGVLGPATRIFPIDKLLVAPGGFVKGSNSMGNGTGLDANRINALLEAIGKAIDSPPGAGLGLPAGLRLVAGGTDPVSLTLSTTTDLGNVLGFSLAANIDSLMHVTPQGTLTLDLNPVGAPVAVTFSAGVSGVGLKVSIAGSPDIQLLPTFSGLGAFAAGAALLPKALDDISAALPGSAIKTAAISLAEALGLHQQNGTFADKEQQWKTLLNGSWSVANWNTVFTNVASLLQLAGVPGNSQANGNTRTWNLPLKAPAAGSVTFAVGWTGTQLSFALGAQQVRIGAGPLALGFQGGFDGTHVVASCDLGLHVQEALSVTAVPMLSVSYTNPSFGLHVYPLGDKGANSKLDIQLLPAPLVTTKSDGIEQFVKGWLFPIAGNLLLDVSPLNTQVWTGKTVGALLTTAGIINAQQHLISPLPGPTQIVTGLLSGLFPLSVTLGDLTLSLVSDVPNGVAGQKKYFGFRIYGAQQITTGDVSISLRFGKDAGIPHPWITDPNRGITFYLFDQSLVFDPRLNVVGLGVDFAGGNDAPLVNTDYLRIGQLAGYLFFDFTLKTKTFQNFGAGLEIDGFGIPLGQALGDNQNGSNPVAAGMLKSDGGGDPQPVNPSAGVWLCYRNGQFTLQLNGELAIWIGIHKKFGPIYIDQIGLEVSAPAKGPEVALLVDGAVQISGLTVQVDELGVVIPLKSLKSPGDWSLDLRGLAVSYDSSGVSIAGGLLKNPGPPVEYDGMLKIEVAGKGFTAVGAYARPSDQLGDYTSMFIFVALPITLGGPPCFFVTGLGGGAGINRRLIPPEITEVPNFVLVAAIDDTTFSNNPMGALKNMATNIPARRGSYWFAAGVRFDSFVLVHSIAVIYVALDKGFEIGVLGVSRLALPTASVAIVSVELALKARFSTAEGILSIQAQLTDNSYLFSKSCQLTGGFAFFTWFPKGQFLISIGGYHPAFQRPPEFPTVPRVGFRWSVSDFIVIKGEAYFALTNTAVMAGGRLEASAHLGPVRAWFTAYADFLISWDPFYYDIAIGVEIGLALDFEVCFIGCAHVHLEITKGADLHIMGPPLHGTVHTSILFVSVTVPFGPSGPPQPDYIEDFSVFKKKYLSAGDPHDKVTGVRISGGLLPPDPPGAKPAPGSKTQPWRVGAEWSFVTETRLPAFTYSTFLNPNVPQAVADAAAIDLAPMDLLNVNPNHDVRIFFGDTANTPVTLAENFIITKTIGLFPEATWRWTDPTHIPAAARTLPAVGGLTIRGIAVPKGESALIPIANMVDDLKERARPLPFNTNTKELTAYLIDLGASADLITLGVSTASSGKMLEAAEQILTGDNLFSKMRESLGVAAQGLSPMARRSLRKSRSAPPLVAPLTTGLTMKAVGLAEPPTIYRVPEKGPVVMKNPRLRAVLQNRPQPTQDVLGALRTTVLTVRAAAGAPRTVPPKPFTLAGARLQRLRSGRAPRPTEIAVSPRTLHNAETGILVGKGHNAAFVKASAMVMGDGIVVPAGTTHIWDIPAEGTYTLSAGGIACLRVVAMDRGGHVLLDSEMVPQETGVVLPALTASVAVQCLGKPPAGFAAPAPGPGAISLALAPAHMQPAAGWQSGGHREQVAANTLLGRGAIVRLGKSSSPVHRGQKTSHTMVRASRATLQQTGVATTFPNAVSVVMVLLDGQDITAASNGDLAVAAEGASLSKTPIPVGGGRRRAVLYDVMVQRVATFTVSVASRAGWTVSGVVGLAGKAQEWAVRMHGNVPERMVPDGPLTPDGSVRIRFSAASDRTTTLPGSTSPVKPTRKVVKRPAAPVKRRKR